MPPVRARSVLCCVLAAPTIAVGLLDAPAPTGPVDTAEVTETTRSDPATAAQTTTVLADALVAAVVSISHTVPASASLQDIEAGFAAVSALLPDGQHTYRLVDATGQPLDTNSTPRGLFEIQALGATCHANYASLPAATVVGAASFRVKM